MTIVVTGGSGFIGTALTKVLLAQGYTIISIDKKGPALSHQNLFFIPCDLEESTLPFNVLERTDAIIHLAGRHTIAEATNDIVATTKHLIASLEQTINKPPLIIAASSIGFYGDTAQTVVDERGTMGGSPHTRLIAAQEREVLRAEEWGCRVVILRTAPVIGHGGFMAPLLRAAQLHLTFRISKEDFWLSWIHLNDLIHIYLFALETGTLQGVVNAVAPQPTKYSSFLRTLQSISRSIRLPLLPFLSWPYKKSVREQLINQQVIPQRLLDKGFAFAYTDIGDALRATLAHTDTYETNR